MAPQGDFEALVQAHAGELFAYLWRLFDGRLEAEDCLQETFVRAFRAFPRLKSHRHLRAWLYRVATNTARSHLRRLAREQSCTAESCSDTAQPGPSPADELERRETLAAVRAAIASLPYKQRAALWMRKYQGLSYAEIADVLGCNQAAARANVYQALTRLRRLFAEMPHGGQQTP